MLLVDSGPAPALGLGFEPRTNRLFVASAPAGGAVIYNDQVSVLRMNRELDEGNIRRVITNPRFREPSTGALFGRNLCVVNAGFDTTPAPDVDYDVVRVRA